MTFFLIPIIVIFGLRMFVSCFDELGYFIGPGMGFHWEYPDPTINSSEKLCLLIEIIHD